MNSSDTPLRITKAFGVNGLKNTIPVDSSTTTDNSGIATFDKGFPDITMQPLSAGGIPPSGKDMNGVLYQITQKQKWADAGGGYQFNTDFADSVSGYPKGAVINSSSLSNKWLNVIEGNSTAPESSTGAYTGWVPVEAYGITTLSVGSSSLILSSLQAAKDTIVINGLLTSNISITFPAWSKKWTIVNNTTGNFTISLSSPGGASVNLSYRIASIDIYGDASGIYLISYRPKLNSSSQISYRSNGEIEMWGSSSGVTGTTSYSGVYESQGILINFPEPFPTACTGVYFSVADVLGAGLQETAWLNSFNSSSFSFYVSCRRASETVPFYWRAFGY